MNLLFSAAAKPRKLPQSLQQIFIGGVPYEWGDNAREYICQQVSRVTRDLSLIDRIDITQVSNFACICSDLDIIAALNANNYSCSRKSVTLASLNREL